MQDSFRRSYLTLPLPGTIAVAAGVATFTATRAARIANAQLSLADTGAGAGATTIVVKVNGTAIVAAADLSIAGAAAGKSVNKAISMGSNQFPGGARINAGDTVTVDVTAIPATAPAAGFVTLDLVQVDA